MKRLDVLGIQAFICIAEAGSFNAAAAFLHISQTALTRRLQKLESNLGLQLVVRTTRSVSISRVGMDFLPRAARLVRELAIACEDLKAHPGEEREQIAIGCLPTIAAGRLVETIRRFGDVRPGVRVQLLDRSATEIREAAVRGELAFAISTLESPHRELLSERLFSEPMVAACPAEHALAGAASIRWKQLEGEPLIGIGALSGNRMLTAQVMEARQLALRFSYEVQHLSTAVGLVRGGAGIAVLPMSAVVGVPPDQLVVVPLVQPKVMRRIELFRRRDMPLSAAGSALRDLVVRSIRTAE